MAAYSLCRDGDHCLGHCLRYGTAEAGIGKGIAGLISCGIAVILGAHPLIVGDGIV